MSKKPEWVAEVDGSTPIEQTFSMAEARTSPVERVRQGIRQRLSERRSRIEQDKRLYKEAYAKALDTKSKAKIRADAYMRAGVRVPKKMKKWQYDALKKRRSAGRVSAPRPTTGYLNIGKEPFQKPQAGEERYASLMDVSGGHSMADSGFSGMSLMDFGTGQSKQKKKGGFSLMEW